MLLPFDCSSFFFLIHTCMYLNDYNPILRVKRLRCIDIVLNLKLRNLRFDFQRQYSLHFFILFIFLSRFKLMDVGRVSLLLLKSVIIGRRLKKKSSISQLFAPLDTSSQLSHATVSHGFKGHIRSKFAS